METRVHQFAAVIAVTTGGSVAVQLRDDKPGVHEPGQLMLWAGRLEGGETPEQGAFRELAEETTLRPDKLEFFTRFRKDPARHTRPGVVYVFVARGVDEAHIDVREGQGYRLLSCEEDLDRPDCSVLTRDILRLFFREAVSTGHGD